MFPFNNNCTLNIVWWYCSDVYIRINRCIFVIQNLHLRNKKCSIRKTTINYMKVTIVIVPYTCCLQRTLKTQAKIRRTNYWHSTNKSTRTILIPYIYCFICPFLFIVLFFCFLLLYFTVHKCFVILYFCFFYIFSCLLQ